MSKQLNPVEFLIRAKSYLPKGIPPTAVVSVECDSTDGEDGGPSYWVYLRKGYRSEHGCGCHTIHEDTLKQVKDMMKTIVRYENDPQDGYGVALIWRPTDCTQPVDKEPDRIGHLRGDFGRSGTEFYTTWFDCHPEFKYKSFKEELDLVVNDLRYGMLKDYKTMSKECRSGSPLTTVFGRECYGFILETDRYIYTLRCIPNRGDYNFYINCYIK